MLILFSFLSVISYPGRIDKQAKLKFLKKVKKLEWIDPLARRPESFKKWEKTVSDRDVFKVSTVIKEYEKRDRGVVAVLVDSRIYSELVTEIDTFADDLVNEGYNVQLDTVSGMDSDSLRNYLSGITDIEGAIFIGELPVAWYEMHDWGAEEFPIELFFMDLDGTWTDSDNDGLYDGHTGDVEPEIWVGRLYARRLLWDDEITLMKNYFDKNHQYRTTGLGVPQRGLSFVDDDWYYYGSCYLDMVYSDLTVITDYDSTVADEYRSQMQKGYEWIHICAHSSPWGHTFKSSSGYSGTVFNYELFVLNPQAVFYNLFACSGTRFVEENYSAGWYLFGDNDGLALVGASKTGSMLYFDDFYTHLGSGDNIGDAFKKWFIANGELSRPWFYGNNILGDPTLKCMMNDGGYEDDEESEMNISVDWSSPEKVDSNPESDAFPELKLINDRLWVIFESGRSPSNGRADIYSLYREYGSWSPAMNIGSHEYWDYKPVIEELNGEPVSVWTHFCTDYNYNLKYSKYSSGSWSAAQNVGIDSSWQMQPSMASSGDTLWLSWQTRKDMVSNIYASFMANSTWSTPEKITLVSGEEFSPVTIMDNSGSPLVFYSKFKDNSSEIWYSRKEGGNWNEYGPVSGTQVKAYRPDAAVSDSFMWVTWESFDDGAGKIYINRYNGSEWEGIQEVPSPCDNNIFPSIVTGPYGRCWIAWQGRYNGEWDIYVSCYETNWSTPEVINLTGPGINNSLEVDSNSLWIAWQNYSDEEWNIYMSEKSLTGIEESDDSIRNSIIRCIPNPFSGNTAITFRLKSKTDVTIEIYDINGREIKTFKEGTLEPGLHRVIWNGKNRKGEKVPSGIYNCLIRNEKYSSGEKLIYVK